MMLVHSNPVCASRVKVTLEYLPAGWLHLDDG